MARQIRPRRVYNDTLSLGYLIEESRADLVRAVHQLEECRRLLQAARLAYGTAVARFDSIVAIYNRLAAEVEPPRRKNRWNGKR